MCIRDRLIIKRLYNYILHRRLHAEGVQRALTAPDKASQDSKPAMFADVYKRQIPGNGPVPGR